VVEILVSRVIFDAVHDALEVRPRALRGFIRGQLRRLLCSMLVLLPGAARVLVAQHDPRAPVSRCAPVTHDRRWNEEEFERPDSGRTSAGDPNEPPQLDSGFTIESLMGDYDVLVIATAGVHIPDTLSRGRLFLRFTDSTFHASSCFGRCDHERYPLFGWTDSSFHFPGGESARTPLSSRTEDDPGITVEYFRSGRRLSFLLGNSYFRSTDSGVILDVFRANSLSFTGRWVDGGIGVSPDQRKPYAHAQGYFCAWRTGLVRRSKSSR
jgi:hypothetical protein